MDMSVDHGFWSFVFFDCLVLCKEGIQSQLISDISDTEEDGMAQDEPEAPTICTKVEVSLLTGLEGVMTGLVGSPAVKSPCWWKLPMETL